MKTTKAMKLNEDLDQARARWEQWFQGTLKEGPILNVMAALDRPREQPLSCAPDTGDRARWLDVENRARAARNAMMNTWFGGDAVPTWFTNFGPGSVAGYLGSPMSFSDRTVWFGEMPDNSLESILNHLHFDEHNEYWQATVALTQRAMELANGDYWVSYTDLGGELDILASLRGTQNLLVDLLETPDLVEQCERKICPLWLRYFHELTAVLSAGQSGYTCWMPVYSDRPWFTLQCDMSAMFSPAMFERFVVPRLKEKATAMGHSIYHWDGPGELPHLDHIVSVPGIDALEYVSVPSDPPNASLHWLPYYRRVTEAGRGLFLRVSEPELIKELTNQLPAEKLAFATHFPSVAQAKRFLQDFGR